MPGAFAATQTLCGHTDYIRCVTVLADGSLLSGSSDSTLKRWTLGADGGFAEAQTLRERAEVNCVAQLADGCLVSGSDDKTLKVWARAGEVVEMWSVVQTLSGHTRTVMCVVPLDDGRIVSGSWDGTLIVWMRGEDGAAS